MKVYARYVVAVVLSALVLSACGDDDDASSTTENDASTAIPAEPEPGTIRLGTGLWIGYAPFILADSHGCFEEAGLDVELEGGFVSADKLNQAFVGGKLDAMTIATNEAFTGSIGRPLEMVLELDVSNEADAILATEDIQDVAGLEGKRVAFPEGETSDLLLRYALGEAGLSIDDVEVVPSPAGDAATALLAGQVDAASTYEPYISPALTKGANVIYTAGEKPGLISDVLAVGEEMAEERPGQVLGLVNAWQCGLDYYNENTKAAQEEIADFFGVPAPDLETAWAGIEFFGIEENAQQLDTEFVATAEEIEQIVLDAGLLPSAVDAASLINPAFVEAAAE